jgi:hypothetical protein
MYLAIWGGYLLAYKCPNPDELINPIWMIGLAAGIVISFLLVSNRYYFLVMVKRLAFFRQHGLYNSSKETFPWKDYPQTHPARAHDNNVPAETAIMIPPFSTFCLTILLITFGNAMLFLRIDFASIWPLMERCDICWFLLAFILLIVAMGLFSNWLQHKLKSGDSEQ